jgi:hypothetical protein
MTIDEIVNRGISHYLKNLIIHRHANARMVQIVLLIWLDHTIDEENDDDCRNTLTQLRHVVSNIKTFIDDGKCIEFINNIHDEKVCIIISGSLGRYIVPRLHYMPQIDSIFIFCSNIQLHELWSKEWPKIKGVFTEVFPICEALKHTVQQCEQNSISINFVMTNGDVFNKNFNEINPSFIFTQILKEIISTIKFDNNDIKQFIDYCRNILADNENELKNVDILERKYHDTTPILWYTYECFLYPMLNRGLRLMDINIITKMGFFISDLHSQIEQLHNKQFHKSDSDNTFTVYHGQSLSKVAFEQMMKTKNGLISFDTLLCASKDRRISFNFAHHAVINLDLVGIFFIMTIDPCKSTTPFAFINKVSHLEGKDEVLFPMNTVFRIREIESMGENNRLFQVDLTLTDDNDEDLRMVTNLIREETFPNLKGWDRLAQLLIKMNQLYKAQEIYNIMLEQTTNESEKENIYHQLEKIKDNQLSSKDTSITFL